MNVCGDAEINIYVRTYVIFKERSKFRGHVIFWMKIKTITIVTCVSNLVIKERSV